MAIIKINKSDRFIAMSIDHLRDNNLSLKAKGLLSLMLSFQNGSEYSIENFSKFCKDGITAIKSSLNELKEKLVANQIILEEESNFINIYKIQKFLESDIANKIRKCKKIEKEKAFCIKIKASDVYEEAKDEEILVQGIIDLYAIDEKDNVILLDYKTDYVQNGNEEILIQKYQKQLQLYKQAIENGLNLKVSQVYLYSLYLNKDIEVKIM